MLPEIVLSAFFVLLVPHALAHGAETSFEQYAGAYFIDVGHDTPFSIEEETLLDFGLFDVVDDQVEGLSNFDEIRASFSSGATVQWSKHVQKPDFGKAFTTVTPSTPGNWILGVSYLYQGKDIATATFPFFIAGTGGASSSAGMMKGVFGVIILLFIGSGVYFFAKRR